MPRLALTSVHLGSANTASFAPTLGLHCAALFHGLTGSGCGERLLTRGFGGSVSLRFFCIFALLTTSNRGRENATKTLGKSFAHRTFTSQRTCQKIDI
jgi:hypothetical protein